MFTTPAGIVTAWTAPIVAPEQSGPIIIETCSTLTILVAASTAAFASQPESPLARTRASPLPIPPLALIKATAACSDSSMTLARSGMGPVKAFSAPIFMSPANAGAATTEVSAATARVLRRRPHAADFIFFILVSSSLVGVKYQKSWTSGHKDSSRRDPQLQEPSMCLNCCSWLATFIARLTAHCTVNHVRP